MSYTWEITSPLIRRVIEFDPAGGLYSTHLIYRATGTDLLASARAAQQWTPEFDFWLDQARITSLENVWDLIEASPEPPGRVSVHLRHRVRALDVRVIFDCDAAGTTKRYQIINGGPTPVTLSRVVIEALPLEIGRPGDLQLKAHYAALPRETYITGRADDGAVSLSNPRTGEAVFLLNEAPGHLKRVETGAWFWEGFARLMYDTDLFPLEIQLAGGAAWATAAAHLVLTRTGQDYTHPHWTLPAVTAAYLRQPAARPAWHYNTWDPFGIGIDAVRVRELISVAGQMGFEIFTLDDGWQARYGENTVSPERFPEGLEPLRAAIETHGMRLGLWAPLAVVDPALAAQPALAAFQCRTADGQVKTTLTAQGEQTVLCLASGYAPLAAARLNDLIERYQLAYLKLDLTTVFNAYGEAPGCHASGHAHASAAESVARIYAAIAEITAMIYARHPDVKIDLTFELWGQKHMVDYGLLRAADLTWLSNVGDNTDEAAGPRQARTLLYQRALAIPVETLLIGNLRAETGNLYEKLGTALGSCPLLLGDLRRLTAAHVAEYGRLIRWHQALRRSVPLNESFFPLGSWQSPSVVAWDGFARLSRAGEGLIVLFRNASPARQAWVQIPIPEAGSYSLVSVITGAALAPRTAAEFQAGFEVAFEAASTLILEVRLVPDPR